MDFSGIPIQWRVLNSIVGWTELRVPFNPIKRNTAGLRLERLTNSKNLANTTFSAMTELNQINYVVNAPCRRATPTVPETCSRRELQ